MDTRLPDGDLTQGYPVPDPSILPMEAQPTYALYAQFIGLVDDPQRLKQQALTNFMQYLTAHALHLAQQRDYHATQQRCKGLQLELLDLLQDIDAMGRKLTDLARERDELLEQIDELRPRY